MKSTELFTLILAGYGALLSTFVFLREWVWRRKEERNDIKPSIELGVGLLSGGGRLEPERFPTITIKVVNHSRRNCYIKAPYFKIDKRPNNLQLISMSQRVRFPYELKQGEEFSYSANLFDLLGSENGWNESKIIRVGVSDTFGKIHMGRKVKTASLLAMADSFAENK